MSRWKIWAGAAGLTGALAASMLVAGPADVAEARPDYRFTTVASGLSIPWDVTWVGPLMLFNQRSGGVWSKRGSAKPGKIEMPMPTPFVNGEGGLLGMVAHPRGRRTSSSTPARPPRRPATSGCCAGG